MERSLTIVEYTNRRPPTNHYPRRIVSPLRSGPCCFADMETLGGPVTEGRWVFEYRRCRTCGFCVRVIVRELEPVELLTWLRKELRHYFVRNDLEE